MAARCWPLAAILIANLLAAVTIFLAGKWVGETNRYAVCDLITLNSQVSYLCPVGEPAPAPSPPPKTEEA